MQFPFSKNVYGALLLMLFGILSTTSNSLTHGLSGNLAPSQVLFLKSAFACLFMVLGLRSRLFQTFKTALLPWHLLKALLGALGNWFFIHALLHTSLAQVSALSLTSALFTSLGGWFIFKEKLRGLSILSLALGFMGSYYILQDKAINLASGDISPLLSALCFSISSLLIKKLATKDSATTILVYLLFFMMLFSALPAFQNWQPVDLQNVGMILAIAGLYVLMQRALVNAYINAEASYLAPFKFARFPLSIASGILFFGEIPELKTWAGGILITAACCMLLYKERRHS